MLEEGGLEADPQVGLLPVAVLLWREGDTRAEGKLLQPATVSSRRAHGHQQSLKEAARSTAPPASLQALLTASFSGLQTFTQRMWSRSQSMGLSR